MVKATTRLKLILLVLALMLFGIATLIRAQTPSTTTAVTSTSVTARDPGVRGGPDGAGGPINGLTARQFEFFTDGKADFEEVEVVADGLGARMNLDSCAGCHAQPTTGGTSPFVNPQVAFASKDAGTDRVPFFITLNGPVREARFKFNPDGTRDGGVHNTATITGRTGTAGCVLAQPDFDTQAVNNNLIFRIPTPVFGAGLSEQNPNCQFATLPNDVTDTEVTNTSAGLNAIEKFAFFQRFLAPPTPSPDTPGGASSISNGRSLFVSTGCALCHTPTLTTGNSTVEALRNQPVNLFSDMLVHAMGPGLADNILQGGAQGDEFRTAPLWGLGQRIFFLHDGRTTDLLQAIQAHKSAGNTTFGPSEANAVIDSFNKLNEGKKQDMLNFLRSL